MISSWFPVSDHTPFACDIIGRLLLDEAWALSLLFGARLSSLVCDAFWSKHVPPAIVYPHQWTWTLRQLSYIVNNTNCPSYLHLGCFCHHNSNELHGLEWASDTITHSDQNQSLGMLTWMPSIYLYLNSRTWVLTTILLQHILSEIT